MARGRPFAKGRSGNPGGRPKALVAVRDLARARTMDAITTLVEVMKSKKASPSARVSAAQALLDRGWGKPQIDARLEVTHDPIKELMRAINGRPESKLSSLLVHDVEERRGSGRTK